MGNTALKNTNITDAGRQDMFWVFPEELKVVEKKDANLYDKRIEKPLDETMVESIMKTGVLQTMIVRKDGRDLFVVDGKQRRAHAIEANKRLVGEDRQPVRVPVMLRVEKTDVAYFEVQITSNAIRQDDDTVTNAENVLFYMNRFGKTADEAAKTWGKTTVTIRSWLRLMELTDTVRDAVRKGDLSANDAVKNLADVARDEQDAALTRYLESAPTTRKGKKTRDGNGAPAKKISPISRLRTIYRSEVIMATLDKKTRLVIEYLYDKATMGDLMATLPDTAEAITAAKAPKAKKAKEPKVAKASKKAAASTNHAPRVSGSARRVSGAVARR